MSYEKPISYSGLKVFKQCPRLWESRYLLKEKPPKSKAADRGTAMHDLLEKFFKGEIQFPHGDPTLNKWRRFMEYLTTFSPSAEMELAVKKDWSETTFDDPDAYYRGKADLSHEEDQGETLAVYDWKSGRIYDDHPEQGLTYISLTVKKEYARYRTKFVYLDLPLQVKNNEYTAEQRDQHIISLREDIEKVRTCEDFTPTPSPNACKWCHLSWRKGGRCKNAA